MRHRLPGPDQAALDRRLALLGEELAWLRPEFEDDLPATSGPRPGAPGQRDPGPAVQTPASVAASAAPAHSDAPAVRPWWEEHTRLSARAASGARITPPVVDPAPQTPAPTARGARSGPGPGPGRHAAPRPVRSMPATPGPVDPLTPAARVRLLLGPAQLGVVTAVVVLALAVTCWWLARGRPESTVALQAAPAVGLTRVPDSSGSTAPSATATSAAGSAAGSAAESAGPVTPAMATAGSVTVDVSGRVRHPGIQTLAAGARIADALTAAGGARPGVDLTALNLAQVLVDGQQVLVGVTGGDGTSSVTGGTPVSTGAAGATSGASGATGAAGAVPVVDLNTATAEQLDSLPDVGPVTAQSILSWRDAHGGFTSVDELLEVDGIGEVTLGKIAPYVTV